MKPTLLVGDFIHVNKYIYGIRIPVINKNVIEGVALLVLATVPVGRWAGVDGIIWYLSPRSWQRKKSGRRATGVSVRRLASRASTAQWPPVTLQAPVQARRVVEMASSREKATMPAATAA